MARQHSEAGYTITELVVFMFASTVMFGVVMTFILVSLRQHEVTVNRVTALDASSIGFERMQRELRQALEISPVPSSATPVVTGVIRARTWVRTSAGQEQHWVRYDCTVSDTCTRTDETAGGVAKSLVDKLVVATGPQTFTITRATAPAVLPSVAITVARTIDGATNPIRLTSVVTPRNCQDGYPEDAPVGPCPG